MSFWVFEPIAHPDDPIWQDRHIWQKVLVAASSVAFARLVAETWALDDGVRQPGNESPSRNSGLKDVRMYSVRKASAEEAPGVTPSDARVISAV